MINCEKCAKICTELKNLFEKLNNKKYANNTNGNNKNKSQIHWSENQYENE